MVTILTLTCLGQGSGQTAKLTAKLSPRLDCIERGIVLLVPGISHRLGAMVIHIDDHRLSHP